TEWLPTFGVSWQVVQLPLITGMPSASFKPPTPLIAIGLVLNNFWPRAIDARAEGEVGPYLSAQASYNVIAFWLNASPVGSAPSTSLTPTWNSWFDSARGPPSTSVSFSDPAPRSHTCAVCRPSSKSTICCTCAALGAAPACACP